MTRTGISMRDASAADLEPLVALDNAHSGQSRRGFFTKRLEAMAGDPEAFVGLVAESGGEVAGFVLARMLDGEFGTTAPVAVLDALGVATGHQGRGIGTRLLGALADEARGRGARELRTQAQWDQALVRFFARNGFSLAPRVVLERATEAPGF